MEAYFDNAATTKPLEAAVKKAVQIYGDCYGNPSSMHGMGIAAEREITAAAKKIAGALGCDPEEVCFNSGGTEADNTAVLGIARARAKRGRHIITTVAEHPAVEQPMRHLEQQGYEITRLGVDMQGNADLSGLKAAVRADTVLVSMQHVNNETGAIQDVATAARIVKERNPEAVVHVDGVQAVGKIPVALHEIDLYTVSAHKLHAFKGTGALIIKKGLRIPPLIMGGGQQGGLRAGTENTAGIAAFALAIEDGVRGLSAAWRHVGDLKGKLITLTADIPGVYINSGANCSPYILNISFTGVRAEVLLNALGLEGIYVSAGSACSSRRREKSALEYYGVGRERFESAIRFSFSRFNTHAEIEYCATVLKRIIRSV